MKSKAKLVKAQSADQSDERSTESFGIGEFEIKKQKERCPEINKRINGLEC